ncbi:MAG: acyl-CoA dehydrogenase [Chloroflexi bacterium]|nr:MAG: acyl-CoA dehydrogenase [Chloroflexota bacterium]
MADIASNLETLRAFVREEIVPRAAQWDAEEQVPAEHVQRLADAGLFAQTVAQDAGGAGRSTLHTVRTVAEVARGCAVSARLVVDANFGAVGMLDRFGNTKLREHWLPRLRAGRSLVSIAMTEPDAGSAVGDLTTTATLDDDEIILHGVKRWITGAGERELSVVLARFGGIPGSAGIGAVLVPWDAPGFRIGRREPTMGLRGLREGELHFEGCRVPAENLLAGPGAFGRLMAAYNGQRVGAAAVSLGIGRGALAVALDYARERRQFGRPIGEFQAIQLLLADMAIQLDAAELLIERAAASVGREGFPERYAASVAKTFAAEAGIFAANTALQVLGGNGYSRNWPVERMVRDARMFTIGGGTTQMQRLGIAQALLAERQEA